MFNNNIKFFSWANFAFFSHVWIHRPTCTFFPRYFFAVVAIFFYCGAELCFASYEESKFFSSTFNFYYGLEESLKSSHIPMLCNGIDPLQFCKYPASESTGGLVEFLSPVAVFAEEVSNPRGENRNQGTGDKSDENFIYIMLSFTAGYCLTCIIIVFVFTQRRSEPERSDRLY